MSVVIFLLWLCILVVEGVLIAALVLHERQAKALLAALSLPISALVNVLIVFFYTLVSVPLLWWTLLLAHAIVIAVSSLLLRRRNPGQIMLATPAVPAPTMWRTVMRLICCILLLGDLFFSVTHLVFLPTYDIDSLTNWTMRSEVSFYDYAIAFDTTESRGVAKPQYPFLFHALQITANQGQAVWNDRAANAILFCTIVGALTSIFVLMRYLRGTDIALLSLTLLTSVPLFAFHLSVAYADILLAVFVPLSFLMLFAYRERQESRWLVLSGLLAASAAWTKLEGFVIALLPVIAYLLFTFHSPIKRATAWKVGSLTLAVSLPFPLLLLFKGLSLTPHSSDTSIGWNGDAFASALGALFTGGSMGITWYVLPVAIILLLIHLQRIQRLRSLPLLFWGLFAFLTVFFAYVLTPNAVFLENGESYYRQLLVPAALLILYCVLMWQGNISKNDHSNSPEKLTLH